MLQCDRIIRDLVFQLTLTSQMHSCDIKWQTLFKNSKHQLERRCEAYRIKSLKILLFTNTVIHSPLTNIDQ